MYAATLWYTHCQLHNSVYLLMTVLLTVEATNILLGKALLVWSDVCAPTCIAGTTVITVCLNGICR